MPAILLCLWIAAVSLAAVIAAVWDKHAAKTRSRRISEAALLWLGAFGGAAAMLLTMKRIRHKTQKPKFMIGLPLMTVFHVLAVGGLLLWYSHTLLIPK